MCIISFQGYNDPRYISLLVVIFEFLSHLFVSCPWWQGSWGQHGAHLGPPGPRWAPCWPHELGLNIFIYAQSGSSLQKLWCSINFALWVLLFSTHPHIDGQVQACSNASALVMELLQSCTHPSLWSFWFIAKIIELLQLQIRSWILRGSGKL